MAILDLFSKRQKRLRGEISDIYTYDVLPHPLKVQIVKIIDDAIGNERFAEENYIETIYKSIHDSLCREYGIFTLLTGYRNYQETLFNYLLHTDDIEKNIDVIELAFRYIFNSSTHTQGHSQYIILKINSDEAIDELNHRFKEHAIGYSFDGGEIIRIDSTYIHNEVTKPTIKLLSNKKFQGANEEYLKAHEHYRTGRNKECLNDCLKAFESTLKVICIEKGWAFNPTDTAKKLIQICFQNELVPTFTQNQFTSLQNLLESGIPTMRNKLGGHGQGQTPQKVDDEMTRYGLNLTGTNIIFLIEQSGIR